MRNSAGNGGRIGPVARTGGLAGAVVPPGVVAVSVGRAVDADWAGRLKRTAIDKRPVGGPVVAGRLGLAGDEHGNPDAHGGVDQAVYVYSREDLDWWAEGLGRPLRDGAFGENLTVRGVDVSGALIGERWRVGGALLEVTAPRIPCGVFRNWMGEEGWVPRFTEAGRPGAYTRVIQEGPVAAGDPIELVGRPDASVTVAQAVLAYHGDTGLLRRLLAVPGISDKWQGIGAHVLGSAPN